MKHLIDFKLFEKSTLTHLGVPNDVMVDIQKEFAISNDAEWQEIKYKKNLRTKLRDKEGYFVVVTDDKVNVIFSLNGVYYMDLYFYEGDDFGDGYWNKERKELNITDILKSVNRGSKIYKMGSGNVSYSSRSKRKLDKKIKEFDSFTNKFKEDFATNFTSIIRKLYKKNSNIIQDVIINNLLHTDKNISPKKAKELLNINIDKAKQSKYMKDKSSEADPFKLQLKYIRDNSLTIFDEYLINFENEMSEKYNEFLTIHEMCNRYGRDKIILAFTYFLYAGKLMDV